MVTMSQLHDWSRRAGECVSRESIERSGAVNSGRGRGGGEGGGDCSVDGGGEGVEGSEGVGSGEGGGEGRGAYATIKVASAE